MQLPPSTVKILKREFENQILSEDWLQILNTGDLYSFEQLLYNTITNLYDKICETLIQLISSRIDFINSQKELAKSKGLKKLVSRPVELQLRRGTKIKYDSLYAKKAPKNFEGSRHLSMYLWPSFKKSSPMYQIACCQLFAPRLI